MIKRLLLLTTLLAPALAYGANPSNDFSVQIAPTGSTGSTGSGGGSPAVPAAALAGCQSANGGGASNGSCFNQLAFNIDFTTNAAVSGYQGQTLVNAQALSNWLDCDMSGGTPLMWIGSFGGDGQNAACGDWSVVSDNVSGTDALFVNFPVDSTDNQHGSAQLTTAPYSAGSTTGATTFPLGFYAEWIWRTDSTYTSIPAGTSFIDFWAYPDQNQGSGEWDFSETYSNAGGGGQAALSGYGQCLSVGNCPGGLTYLSNTYSPLNNYVTYGLRFTQDGSGNVAWCNYINNTQQGCATASGTGALTEAVHMLILNGTFTRSGTAHLYLQRYRVWDCRNWRQANYPTYNGAACAGVVLTTNP